MASRNLICIVCPKGCKIEVELEGKEVINVKGHTCKRGLEYAKSECLSPMRTLTTTAPLENGGVVAVKTDRPIPKELLFECVALINKTTVPKGTKIGTVIIPDVLSTGANVITTANATE